MQPDDILEHLSQWLLPPAVPMQPDDTLELEPYAAPHHGPCLPGTLQL